MIWEPIPKADVPEGMQVVPAPDPPWFLRAKRLRLVGWKAGGQLYVCATAGAARGTPVVQGDTMKVTMAQSRLHCVPESDEDKALLVRVARMVRAFGLRYVRVDYDRAELFQAQVRSLDIDFVTRGLG